MGKWVTNVPISAQVVLETDTGEVLGNFTFTRLSSGRATISFDFPTNIRVKVKRPMPTTVELDCTAVEARAMAHAAMEYVPRRKKGGGD